MAEGLVWVWCRSVVVPPSSSFVLKAGLRVFLKEVTAWRMMCRQTSWLVATRRVDHRVVDMTGA